MSQSAGFNIAVVELFAFKGQVGRKWTVRRPIRRLAWVVVELEEL